MNSFFEIDFLVQSVSEQEGNAEGISLCSVFSWTEEQTEEQTKEQQVDDDDDEGSDLLLKEQDDPLLVILCQKPSLQGVCWWKHPQDLMGESRKCSSSVYQRLEKDEEEEEEEGRS